MANTEKVKKLLQAFRDFDDAAFLRAAEAIIEESVASNRMSEAKELKRALGEGHKAIGPSFSPQRMNTLPSANRSDSKLLELKESEIHAHQIVLAALSNEKISRVIQEHKNKDVLHKHGLRAKSKLLFWGPPGCGKTMTSMFLAHELGMPIAILQISSLISSYLGDTANHIQKIFDYANNQPVVLLLDEFDAIGKSRTDIQDVGEIRRVVNSILQAFDTFASDKSVIVAASNHQDILDEALWRRFDDIISFPKPSKDEREVFLKRLMSGIHFDGSLGKASLEMKNLSYAEIEKIVKETLKSKLMSNSKRVTYEDLHLQINQYQSDISQARNPLSTRKK
jgi:SpoVK/Ycf46/Vps4 family AAA+-type ATPase